MDLEIVEVPDQQTVVITEEQPAEIISEGIQGPPGPAMSTIGGLGIELTNPTPGDLLALGNANKWTNVPKIEITDGGNF
jgi:hypothetical protein